MPGPPDEPAESEVTPEALFDRRREFLKNSVLFTGTAAAIGTGLVGLLGRPGKKRASEGPRLGPERGVNGRAPRSADAGGVSLDGDALTDFDDVTTYNNFYELGLGKMDPSQSGNLLKTRPWTIVVEGEVAKPRTFDIDALLREFPLQQRIYRMRCVEAWSMVIPWLGFPLADLLARVKPTSKARYVAFTTLLDPEMLPGQRRSVLDWPYVEGLRLDEAMHPLTLLAGGLYGKPLLGQNGAPLRLVVPWKYGFKGIKSIVRIRLTEEQPPTSWNRAAPNEYGFYANVNPEVDHPRWSQATERRIGELERRATLPFNGYGAQVAWLYQGLDLRRNF